MNHEHINQFNVIDQYLLGHLTASEAEEFEDHFIDCPTCVEQLNTTRNLVQDLKGLAVQETLVWGREKASSTRGQRLKRLVPSRRSLAVALGCIALAGVLSFVAFRRITQLEAELHQTQEAASTIQKEYQLSVANAAESERQHQEASQQLAQRVDELERKLKDEGLNQSGVGSLGVSEINFPIFPLVSVPRGQAPAPTAVALPASSPRFAFSIPLEDRRDFSVYRVTIMDQGGRIVWKQGGFRPDQYHSLSLSLSSSLLSPGAYDLRVEGRTPPSDWSVVGSYPFSLVRRR